MITVNICGYDSRHKKVLHTCLPEGYDDYVILLIKSNSYFIKDNILKDHAPNTVMIYSPHTPIDYGCHDNDYNDDWIHFELSGEDEDLPSRLNLPLNTPFSLPLMGGLTSYSKLIVKESISVHLHREENIDHMMHALLNGVSDQLHEENSSMENKYFREFYDLRQQIMNAPYQKWDTAALADHIHVSISHFQHLYRKFFDTTCVQDIILARVHLAQFYLTTTDMSISSLADTCGYENELHFMRQFKKVTGMTPSQYRQVNRRRDNKFNP